MYFNKSLALLAICCLSVLQAAVINPQSKKPAKKVARRMYTFNGTWVTDNEFYYTAADRSIHKFNAATGTNSIFVASDFLKIYKRGSSFVLSPDNTKILVRYDIEGVFRYSFKAKYDIFDIATQRSLKIHNGAKLQYCAWSPIKNRLAYVYNNNVFVHFGENEEVQITSDGVNGVVYNGIPDWVYEEEVLNSGSALWWSDDGNFLAVGVFNDTNVETFKYFLYGEADDPKYQYPKEVDLKYPKSGTNNPEVTLRVFILSSPPNYVTIKAPVNVVGKDHILQNVVWTSGGELLTTWMNRRQNIASLQLCSVMGKCQEVRRIEEPKGWVTIGYPLCLKKTQNCLFTYWINNWFQIWNLNLQTGENVWKSRGNFTVLQVYGYDEINDKIYYQATLSSDPSIYHVFSNNDCLTCNLTDEDGEKCLFASASFSKDYSYYAALCDGPNPSFIKIYQTKANSEVNNWEPNTAFRAMFSKKQNIKILKVPLADGSMGMAKLQFPVNFDVNKKYPMIINVYGGPNIVTVTNSFSLYFNTYMTANHEVLYVQIDGRGSANKGKDLLFSVNNHLGEFEVEDQIFVTKYLQNQFPFVDKDRCGIWGWSYGGYMTARTLANDTEKVFQCGLSVAPVSSWLYYDSIYTERFMDVPSKNMKKYLDTSVLQQIDNFRKHDFMLIHGSGDDNVHYQHSMLLAKILQQNNILFKQMTFTDANHGLGYYRNYLFYNMEEFWINCLRLDVKEKP